MPSSEAKNDPIANELVRVMNITRRVPITEPGKRIQGLRLTAHEYDELYLLSRSTPARETEYEGLIFSEALQQTMNSSEYIGSLPDVQVETLRYVQTIYDEEARKDLPKVNPEFRGRLIDHLLKIQFLRGDKSSPALLELFE